MSKKIPFWFVALILIVIFLFLNKTNDDPYEMFTTLSTYLILFLSVQLLFFALYASYKKNPFLLTLVFWNIAFILIRLNSIPFFGLSLYFQRISEPYSDAVNKSVICLILMNFAVFAGTTIGFLNSKSKHK